MTKIALSILTPTQTIYDAEVDKIVLPSTSGEIGILPNHANLVTRILPGELTITINGKNTHYALGDGLLTVSNNQVTLLTDLAQTSSEIDEKAVLEAKKRAEEALSHKLSSEEYATTFAVLQKTLAQLKVKRRHHQ